MAGKSKDNKPHGLPERIAKLPKDHPERKRYEKGWQAEALEYQEGMERRHAWGLVLGLDWESFKPALVLLLVVALGVGGFHYYQEVEQRRRDIWHTVHTKGWAPTDPIIRQRFGDTDATLSLPRLNQLLEEARALLFKPRALEEFSRANPEPGGYLDHIKRHNLPFSAADAIRWLANSYR